MTQRHRYIVPIVDRHTGQELERTVDAVSAADAQAQLASDPTVYVGTARRADGTAEASSSPFDRAAHHGFRPDQDDEAEPDPQPDRSSIDRRSYELSDAHQTDRIEDTLRDILAVGKLQSDRTAWIQRFLVWSFYGVPLAVIGAIAGLTALGMLGSRDALTSASALVPAFIALLCFACLMFLLQSIHPTFGPRKKPFQPIRSDDEDLDRLRRRIEARRRARR